MPVEAPPEQPFFAQGIPVEIGKVQRELKKLWQDSHETATRASRLNLVIYSDADSSLRANTALVEQIARQHALRAILIAAKANTGGNGVRAWVNAHCQVSKGGGKQRCSEQIAFQLEGDAARRELVPNIILGNLDSDLPLYLWRQGEFSDAPNEQLMAWVDCLIFDSAGWPQPAQAVRHREETRRRRGPGTRPGRPELDAPVRSAARGRAVLRRSRHALRRWRVWTRVEVTHAPGARTQAILFVGWLAAQLGWKPAADAERIPECGRLGGEGRFSRARRRGIGRVMLHADWTAATSRSAVRRVRGFSTRARCALRTDHELCQVLPVGPEETAELVSAELVHGGGHRVYLKALALVEGMWG